MALGNWDSDAILIAGEKKDGYKYSAQTNKFSICLYKNWIYLYSVNEGQHIAFGEVHEGKINIDGIFIYAVRGPQNGIYAIIEHGFAKREDHYVILWAGVYGYNDDVWVGINDESRKFIDDLISKYKENRISIY